MAKLKQNAVMQGTSGKIGKTVLFRVMPNGDTIVGNLPKRKAKATPSELVERDKFRKAAAIARIYAKDPILGPQYLAKAKPGQGAYHVALVEQLNKDKPRAAKPITRKTQPLTLEVSIEIAKLSMLAVNRIVSSQRVTAFGQQTNKLTTQLINQPSNKLTNQQRPAPTLGVSSRLLRHKKNLAQSDKRLAHSIKTKQRACTKTNQTIEMAQNLRKEKLLSISKKQE